MRIVFENVVLRSWDKSDAQRLATIAGNKKIYDNLRDAFPHPYTVSDAEKFIVAAQQDDTPALLLAIELNGLVVGSIGASFKDDVYRLNAEIGYFVAEEYWGLGVATKALHALVPFLFKNYAITRIYAEPFAWNSASRRALEKAGFRLEAILKGNVIKNGVIGDSCIYAILKS
jgi:ribosomal-protein-alanine N-acetyltransferase